MHRDWGLMYGTLNWAAEILHNLVIKGPDIDPLLRCIMGYVQDVYF